MLLGITYYCWVDVNAKTANEEGQLQALVYGKKVLITESTIRKDLQLKDAEGVDCLPNAVIFEQLTLIGFVQVFQNNQLEGMSNDNMIYVTPSHTKKIFRNMKRVGKGFSRRDTPLFPTMMVQAQEDMGEGLANPTDPHHTPTVIQPSISQPQKNKRHMKPRRKVTEVPHPSDPTSVADEAVNEEMNDSLEMVATTATSLDAEQDMGNIFKTQSKATPNELGSQGTSSGGSLRCQEATGDTIVQTRSERVSKISNDPLLIGVNTPRSGKDSLKLNELMELCTKLQQRVLDLETTKTNQALEIDSLKRKVKKLERRKRSRTHRLKRLYKVRLSARVESFKDKGLGEKDASKQGRISDIDAVEDITIVSTHDNAQMFDADKDLHGEEVFVAQQDENVVEKEVDDAQVKVTTALTIPTVSIDEATLAQALAELNMQNLRPRLKGLLQAEEQQELNDEEKAKLFMQLLEKRRKFFAVKRAEEKRNKPPTQAQQRKIMCTYLKNMEGKKLTDLKNKSFDSIQKMFDRAFKRKVVQRELEKRLNNKKQKIDDDKDTTELKQLVKIIPDEEGIEIGAIPLAIKPPSIVDWKIQKEGKKSYYKIIRADGSSKIYLIFSHMLKYFDIEYVETLLKLVKDKYGSTRPEGDYERVL
uniref:Uncharacterized protein n=1 Tax=Tanacetum cinerariifolium TaxID=118510 RepID=A0A699ISE7_TANCI|nr:hypothetical protein [Tanacetum cinerariifolium]